MNARRRIAAGVAVTLALLAAGLVTLATTEPGARLALRAASALSGGRFEAGVVRGTLRGPLTLLDLRYRDAGAGLDLEVGRLQLALQPRALLRPRLQVTRLELQHIRVRLSAPTEPPSDEPFPFDPPLDLQLDALTLRDAIVERDGAELLRISRGAAAATWTDAGLDIRHLDLLGPDGELHFAGILDERDGRFAGQAAGRFRWRAGEHRIVGRIEARTRDTLADLSLRLSEPLAARLDLGLEQRQDLPWHFTLDVPAFDPRQSLAPDAAVRHLAAQLTGRGSLQRGAASGSLQVDDQRIELQPLKLERRGEDLAIDATVRHARGVLRANGELGLGRTPLGGRFELDWRDVVLPRSLAGQPLHSRGRASLEGSLERYAMRADFALGPPRRLADVRLAARGTAQGIDLEQLEVRQAGGRLAARGRIDFGAPLRWKIDAEARDFDPGVFAAGWPGRLSFELASRGAARDLADTSATLDLRALRGRLRGRAVAGDADLRLTPGPLLAGAAELRSGSSRLQIESRGGERLQARMRADIPTLDDWLPGAAGVVSADFSASGKWPMLAIEGAARAHGLRYDTLRGDAVDLHLDVVRPLEPRGTLRLDARGLQGAGLEVRTLALRADGEPASHRLQLEFDGAPVAARLQLSGAGAGGAWRGEIGQLLIDAPGVARLALQQPVALAWSGGVLELARACLADGETRLCLEGRGGTDGALQGRYELANLPLALASTFAPTALPVALEGTIDGDGRIARDAAGALQGMAQLRAARGRVSLAPDAGASEARRLLDYADLRFDADFAASGMRASLVARIDEYGSVEARLAASDLGGARTPLDGLLRIHVPSLAAAGAFVPQLANVDGRLDLDATIAGTLDEPVLGGELRATELTTDVPELGIELRAGRLRILPAGTGRYALEGGLRSGSGELTLRGTAQDDGELDLEIEGRDFLAADRPGARVVIAPALRLKRAAAGRIDAEGRVLVPAATIDVQRLPRGDGARAPSPDVVVVDDAAGLAPDAAALPLHANVEVRLGERVKLVGFGLDATVAGSLRVMEVPGAVTTGSGEIRVAGTYKAYGQDLTIRQGQLLYAATPLDDPRLNMVAVRVVDNVTAGLRVTGRARAPQLEVFSDPAMGQSSALSYLVTGKPLEAIGVGNAEGDALQAAARSLGAAAGGLLAKNVGRRLGIDEVGIRASAAVGGEVLTIGQYLSPRLYLGYGVGLFKPGEVVTLRYRIAEGLSLEAENATESSRAGVQYRIER